MKKLYIGNLSYSTNESALGAAFEQFGPISSVKIITDKFSGESRGFGFVEIESDEQAEAAIQQMNGFTLDGKALKVNEARPMESRGGGGGGGGGYGDRRPRRDGGGGGFRSDRGDGGGRSNRGRY
jgi:cold-inducible RNA-binding protein